MGWNGEEFTLYAKVEGQILDLVRFSSRSPLNTIPTATLTIAMGRRAATNEPSAIHQMLDILKTKRKVEVWFKSKPLGQLLGVFDLNQLPSEEFKIFEGYTLGPGYIRSSSAAEYSLECEHWLADLSYAPSTSAISSPTNPSSLIFNALIANPAEVAGGIALTGGYTGLTDAESFMTPENISDDFWGKAIQPYFRALTQLETLIDTDAASQIGLDLDPVPEGNTPARDALDRFEPVVTGEVNVGIGGAVENKEYTFGVPLKFDRGAYGGDMEFCAQQIEMAMGSETLEAMSGSTLWDKLVIYASTYLFAIVPCIDRTLIVPFVPGLRTEFITISAGEYDYIQLSGGTPRILRGVGIYGGKGFQGGAEMAGDDPVAYDSLTIGGYFQGATTGQIMFLQCPMWMADCTLYSESDRSSGAGGRVRGDALSPGAGTDPAKPKPAKKAADNAVLMDAYAEAVYTYEILKHRAGQLSGRFRLDISPGSCIKIEGCGEQFLGTSDQFGQELWATVLQVDLHLDAQQGKAATSFHLAHVRNALDNETRGFSLARHPIWTEVWKGAPMTAEAATDA